MIAQAISVVLGILLLVLWLLWIYGPASVMLDIYYADFRKWKFAVYGWAWLLFWSGLTLIFAISL